MSDVISDLLALAAWKPKPKPTSGRELTEVEQLLAIAAYKPQDPEEKKADEALIKDLNERNIAEGTYGIPITRSPFVSPGQPGYDREQLGGSAVSAKTFQRQGPTVPVKDADAAWALARGTFAGTVKGVLSTVEAIVPDFYKFWADVAETDRSTFERYLAQPTLGVGGFKPEEASALSAAPGLVGEFAGMAVPGVGSVKAANAVWKVTKATTDLKRIGAAGATAGTMFSAFAQADSGEDRVYNIALNAALGAAVDVGVMMAVTGRAIRTEIKAGKNLEKIVDEISTKTGVHPETVESKLSTMRGGLGSTDVKTATAVLEATKGTPAEKSPLAQQAAQIVEAFKMNAPGFWTVQAGLKRGSGIHMRMSVDGAEETVVFKSDPTGQNKRLFPESVAAWVQRVALARMQGKRVEILEAMHGAEDTGAASRFMGLMTGETGRKKNPLRGRGAPAGTVSHSGHIPDVGATVTVRVPGGGTVTGTVLEIGTEVPGPQRPGQVRVRRNAAGKWTAVSAEHGEEVFETVKAAQARARFLTSEEGKAVAGAKAAVPRAVAETAAEDAEQAALDQVKAGTRKPVTEIEQIADEAEAGLISSVPGGNPAYKPGDASVRQNPIGGYDVITSDRTETYATAQEAYTRRAQLDATAKPKASPNDLTAIVYEKGIYATAKQQGISIEELEKTVRQASTGKEKTQALKELKQHKVRQANAAKTERKADINVEEECKSPCKWTVRDSRGKVLEEFEDKENAQAYAKSIAGKHEFVRVVRPGAPEVARRSGGAAAPSAPAPDLTPGTLGVPEAKKQPTGAAFTVSRVASVRGDYWAKKGVWAVRDATGKQVKVFRDPDKALAYAENLAAGKPVTLFTKDKSKTTFVRGGQRHEYLFNARGERVDENGQVLGKKYERAAPFEGTGREFAETPEERFESNLMRGEKPDVAERVQGREAVPRSRSYMLQAVPQALKPYITQDQYALLDYPRRINLAREAGLPDVVQQLMEESRQYAIETAAARGSVRGVGATMRRIAPTLGEPLGPHISEEFGRELPLPRFTGQLQPGYIRLEVNGKEIVAPFTDVNGVIPQGRSLLDFRAHRSGKTRHFTIDLETGKLEPEPLDSPGDWWRSDDFFTADPSSDYQHNVPRGFIHRDGSLTISVTPVVLQETESMFGKRANIGALDRAQPIAQSETGAYHMSRGGKSATGDLAPEHEGDYWTNRYTAGFEPYGQRITQRTTLGDEVTDASGLVDRSILYDENVALEDLDTTARRRVQKIHEGQSHTIENMEGTGWQWGDPVRQTGGAIDRTQRPDVMYKDPVTGKWKMGDPTLRVSTLRSYELFGKNQGNNPNAVQFRNAARKLIAAGVDENMPVRLRVAHTNHAPGKQAPAMTLREAANINLGWVTPQKLESEAALRGMTVTRDVKAGTWIVERSLTGERQVFAHPMEALDAVASIPIPKENGVKIEGSLERALNMGRDRGRDPDVDAKIFLPAKAVDTAFQEVVAGGRPGMEFWVKPTDPRGSVQEAFKKGTQAVLSELKLQAAEPVVRIQMLLDNFAQKVPEMRGLKVWTATELVKEGDRFGMKTKVVNGRVKTFIYNEERVRATLTQWEKGFQALGVDLKDSRGQMKTIPELLTEIDDKIPDGLDILKGRDPSDALMYSWYKSKSMKEEFMRGTLREDSQGRYRVFSPEEKNANFAKLPEC